MGYFEIFYALFAAQVNISVKEGKVKGIFACLKGYIHKLNCLSVCTYLGIERRGEHGNEDSIYAISHSTFDIVPHYLKMALGIDGNVIIVRKAVNMEPVGAYMLLIGQVCANDLDIDAFACNYLIRIDYGG